MGSRQDGRGPSSPDCPLRPELVAEYAPIWSYQKGVGSRMIRIERLLRIDLPARQSAFLWGPRKTGKSTYLRSAFPDSLTFDLLQTDLMLELAKRLGFRGFDWVGPDQVFNEYCSLSPIYFGMDWERISTGPGLQWPVPEKDHPGTPRLHEEAFPNGTVELIWGMSQRAPDLQHDIWALAAGRPRLSRGGANPMPRVGDVGDLRGRLGP